MAITDMNAPYKKHEVMASTWGHLYPEPGRKYNGKILVCHHDDQTVLLDRQFQGLENSPQEFELASSILDQFFWSPGLHEVHCTLWFFKTCNDYLGPVGKVIKPRVRTLYSTTGWNI